MSLLTRLIHVMIIVALLGMLSGAGATVSAGGCMKAQKIDVCVDPAHPGGMDTKPKKEAASKTCLDALLDCDNPPSFSAPGQPVAQNAAMSGPLTLPVSHWKPPRISA